MDHELKRRLKTSKTPYYLDISNFIFYMLNSMHISSGSAKSICLLVLIYLERIIQRTQSLTINSFNCKKG